MTVCLNMIVRDEAHVIERCLRSHKDVIDCAVICDTGSTDGTQDVIRRTMADLGTPCEIHERPWVNFGYNRTEALQLAKGKADYILVNDADHVFHGTIPKVLTENCYAVEWRYGNLRYGNVALLSDRLDWRYVGVLHEYVESVPPMAGQKKEMLRSCYIEVFPAGARSKDPQKFQKDAAILEKELQKDPNNTRYVFYLAQSYRDCGRLQDAIDTYERRAAMGGWDQEAWYAYYQAAYLREWLGKDAKEISYAYLRAYQYRSSRAEPLYRLARYHRLRSEYSLAYLYASQAALIKITTDHLFVEEEIYTWKSLDELAISAFYSNQHDVGIAAARAVLKRPHPAHETARLEANLGFYEPKPVDKVAA